MEIMENCFTVVPQNHLYIGEVVLVINPLKYLVNSHNLHTGGLH